jgi:hypothetical protein
METPATAPAQVFSPARRRSPAPRDAPWNGLSAPGSLEKRDEEPGQTGAEAGAACPTDALRPTRSIASGADLKRYGYAAQHLATCVDLVERIETFTPIEQHDAYVGRLKVEHGKKTGFWSKVKG